LNGSTGPGFRRGEHHTTPEHRFVPNIPNELARLRADQVTLRTNYRKSLGDPQKAIALALSRITNQIHPLVATRKRVLIDGYRTIWGLELLGRLDAELDFILTDEDRPDKIALMQGLSAIHREDWPLADKCEWVIELSKTMAGKDIAAELGVDAAMVSNWKAYDKLIPEAKQAVRDGMLNLRSLVAIAKLPYEEQPELLAESLSGATAEQTARQSRKRRNGHGKAASVTATTILVVLKSGITVTFKAEGLTLAKAFDAQAEVRQELKAAVEDGDHDAKTFNALMKKRAKELNGHPATSAGQAPATTGV
jgi:hypothetical protein